MLILTNMVPVKNHEVIGRILNNEAVLVLPGKGQVKVVNEVGTRIWSSIDGLRTVGDIIAIIQTEYAVGEQEASEDISTFLSKLADRGIITFMASN